MKHLHTFVLAAATLALAGLASAGTICPGGNSTNFAHDPDPMGTGCNTLITINRNKSVTVTVTDATPYDNVEDTLVGVLNNSTQDITSLMLTGNNIFGLDGDGVCFYSWAAANGVASSSYCKSSDPADYYGPTSTFSITDANTGVVYFSGGGIASKGGSTFFSLEEPPSASLSAVVSPEPSSYALIASGIGALLFYRRRHGAATL